MGIGEYFLSVITASVITALVGLLIGDDKAAFGRIAGTVSALFLLCVIISPLSGVIARAKDELGTEGNAIHSPDECAYLTSLAESAKRIAAVAWGL